MAAITFEVIFIVLLLLANGVFAMSELAIVSARKPRLRQMCNNGDSKACAALELAASPDRFLSTIQIGITLVENPFEPIGAGLSGEINGPR